LQFLLKDPVHYLPKKSPTNAAKGTFVSNVSKNAINGMLTPAKNIMHTSMRFRFTNGRSPRKPNSIRPTVFPIPKIEKHMHSFNKNVKRYRVSSTILWDILPNKDVLLTSYKAMHVYNIYNK